MMKLRVMVMFILLKINFADLSIFEKRYFFLLLLLVYLFCLYLFVLMRFNYLWIIKFKRSGTKDPVFDSISVSVHGRVSQCPSIDL